MGTGHSMILAVNRPWALQHCQTRKDTVTQVIDKAPPRVCTKNTVQGIVLRCYYSMRRSRVLYLPQDALECYIFKHI